MSTKLSVQIFELRSKGYSYKQICQELKCSKSLVCYYCGEGQKEKTLDRHHKNFKTNPLLSKITTFCRDRNRKGRPQNLKSNKKINLILNSKIQKFHFKGDKKYMFSVDDLKKKIGDNPKCYLTGKPIDLSKSSTYQLDHIVPKSRGGNNSIENCGLACKEANQAKSTMLVSEFIQLCQNVVDHNKNNTN